MSAAFWRWENWRSAHELLEVNRGVRRAGMYSGRHSSDTAGTGRLMCWAHSRLTRVFSKNTHTHEVNVIRFCAWFCIRGARLSRSFIENVLWRGFKKPLSLRSGVTCERPVNKLWFTYTDFHSFQYVYLCQSGVERRRVYFITSFNLFVFKLLFPEQNQSSYANVEK